MDKKIPKQMIPEKDSFHFTAFFASILGLFLVFFLYLSLRPVPQDPKIYYYLANLRAITEAGSFFGPEEPLPVLLLFFWKSLFSLNYLTSLQSLSAFLYSLCLHLVMLLFYKKRWKLNHYFIVCFACFLPYTSEFPLVYFRELVGLFFLLLLFHTFRMETFLDLLVFPMLVLALFFTDLRFFLLGFTIFAVICLSDSARKFRNRTTVFYKKRNIPFFLLLAYLFSLFLCLLLFSVYGFFSESSFSDLVLHWGKILLYLFPGIVTIFLGNLLIDTEKELRTVTFTFVLILSTLGVILWNYTKYDPDTMRELTQEKDGFVRSIPSIPKSAVYVRREFSEYLYFQTRLVTFYLQKKPLPPESMIKVEEIWSADIQEIQKLFGQKGKKGGPEILVLGETQALIPRKWEDRILQEMSNHPAQKKLKKALDQLEDTQPYTEFREWQLRILGFSHLQKI